MKHVTIFQIKLFSFTSSLSGFLCSDPLLFSRRLARLSLHHRGTFFSLGFLSFCPCVCLSVCLSGFNLLFFLPIALSGLIFSFLSHSQAFSFFSPSLSLCLCLSLIPVCLPSPPPPPPPLITVSVFGSLSHFLSGFRPLIAFPFSVYLSGFSLSLSHSLFLGQIFGYAIMPQADTEGIPPPPPRQFVLFALFTEATGKLMN